MTVDKYSFETDQEKEMYFIDKIIEQKQREIEKLESEREKIILTQMENNFEKAKEL